MTPIEVPEVYEEAWFDETRWKVIYGGAGGAKSHFVARKYLVRLTTEDNNHKILVLRKVANTLRVSVYALFKKLIYAHFNPKDFKINKSDMTIEYIPLGAQLIFMGLDDIEKMKSIEGITAIWVEEASECDIGDILELNRRLRGHTAFYKEFILTFNPISHLHWLKGHFFDNDATEAFILKTTYLDNPFIDEEYVKELEDIKFYDEQQYRIYALGEWGILNQNIIHHRFKPMEHLSDKTLDDFVVIHCGVDFNIGGCCVVTMGEDRNGITHVVDEFVTYDTENMIIELQNRYHNKEVTLYPDASGANRHTNSNVTDIDMLRQAGFSCIVPSENGATSTRYNACNRRFMNNAILVNQHTARKTYEALQTHAYDDKGLPEKFKDHAGGAIDDWTDAFGYAIVRLYPITAPVHVVKANLYG